MNDSNLKISKATFNPKDVNKNMKDAIKEQIMRLTLISTDLKGIIKQIALNKIDARYCIIK